MGVRYTDLVLHYDESLRAELRSPVVEMMDAYEDMLSMQAQLCFVCSLPHDLVVPVRERSGTLLAFACSDCKRYVKGDVQ